MSEFPSMHNRPTAVGAHIYSGGLTLGMSTRFDILGQWEEGPWGADTFELNFPDVPHPLSIDKWPIRAMAGKTNVFYGNPPCLSHDTRVLTRDGWRLIKELVRNRERVEVATMLNNRIVYRFINAWHANERNGRTFYNLSLAFGARRRGRQERAIITNDHLVYTRDNGWIPAMHVNGLHVATGEIAPNVQQQALIDGMLLGDSAINSEGQLRCYQINEDYVRLKENALNTLFSHRDDRIREHPRKTLAGFYCDVRIWSRQQRARWYPNGKKIVPDDIIISDELLAAWYLDDGTLRKGSNSEHIQLCTDSFSIPDIIRLVALLNTAGIESRITSKKRYPRITVTVRGAKEFFWRIARFVPLSLRYKLPNDAAIFNLNAYNLGEPVAGFSICTTSIVRSVKRIFPHKVYCLGVEETENFITKGGVVHNCAPWSTAGAGLGMRDPRLLFTRNVFNTALQVNPDIFMIESVCRAWSPNGGQELYKELAQQANHHGYEVTIFLTNAILHDAPQWRERFHFIAHKRRITFPTPRDIHVRTVRDVIGDLEGSVIFDQYVRSGKKLLAPTKSHLAAVPNHVTRTPNPREQRVIDVLEEGAKWKATADRLNAEGIDAARHRVIAQRLRYDAPSPTIADMEAFVHPTENRYISIREAARLCTYPDTFIFAQNERCRTCETDVTQAVLPSVGAYLARRFNIALDDEAITGTPGITVVDERHFAVPFRPRTYGK